MKALFNFLVAVPGATLVLILTANGQTNTFPSFGFVGIGTTSPEAALHIHGVDTSASVDGGYTPLILEDPTATPGHNKFGFITRSNDGGDNSLGIADLCASSMRLMIKGNGNVGIGTAGPGALLEVARPGAAAEVRINSNTTTDNEPRLSFYSSYPNSFERNWGIATSQYHLGDLGINQSNAEGGNPISAGTIRLYVSSTGKVGIGTTDPDQALAVNGAVHAKEVIVDDSGWPDFVFDTTYRLAPLGEIEQTIKAQKHLPGMPSAKEVADYGVKMGEIQANLLAQMEEMTLRIIAQEKRLTPKIKRSSD